MKEHNDIRELLSLAAAGALEAGEQSRVEEHLRQCEACRAEFDGWLRLTGTLQDLPTPQARPALLEQTMRALARRAAEPQAHRTNHFMLGLLVLFAWTATLLNWPLLRLCEGRLEQWLDISSGQLTGLFFWGEVSYLVMAWLGTALAAVLLVRQRRQREGATI